MRPSCRRQFGVTVCYHAQDRPWLTRQTASRGIRGWLGKKIPEEGVLVLLRGLLEEAAPESVTANRFVAGEVIEGSFRVLATPGHTQGHVAYLHVPTQSLFCGDALAVVAGQLRLMARPVTLGLADSEVTRPAVSARGRKVYLPGASWSSPRKRKGRASSPSAIFGERRLLAIARLRIAFFG